MTLFTRQFVVLIILLSTAAFAAENPCETLVRPSRGFTRAMSLRTGDLVFVALPAEEGAIHFAEPAVIEAVTRDHRFVVSTSTQKNIFVDWRDLGIAENFRGLEVGKSIQHRNFLGEIERSTYLGHTLDENHLIITESKRLQTISKSNEKLLILASTANVMSFLQSVGPVPRRVNFRVGDTFKTGQLMKVNGAVGSIDFDGRSVEVDMSDILLTTGQFAENETVILEEPDGRAIYGHVIGQSRTGQLLFRSLDGQSSKVVESRLINKLARVNQTPKLPFGRTTLSLQSVSEAKLFDSVLSANRVSALEIEKSATGFRIDFGSYSYHYQFALSLNFENENRIEASSIKEVEAGIEIRTPGSREVILLSPKTSADGLTLTVSYRATESSPAKIVATYGTASNLAVPASSAGKPDTQARSLEISNGFFGDKVTFVEEKALFHLTELRNDYFEESLSIEEYPALEIQGGEHPFEVTIGASLYSLAAGDKIAFDDRSSLPNVGRLNQRRLTIIPAESEEKLILIFSKFNDGSGHFVTEVELQKQGLSSSLETIAIFSDAQ